MLEKEHALANRQLHGQRSEELEATVLAIDIRRSGMEERAEKRLEAIENKLDKLWRSSTRSSPYYSCCELISQAVEGWCLADDLVRVSRRSVLGANTERRSCRCVARIYFKSKSKNKSMSSREWAVSDAEGAERSNAIANLFPKYDFYVVITYGLLIGVLYLWAYWRNFGVNAFEYLALTDIPLLALYGVLPALLVMPPAAVLIGPLLSRDGTASSLRPRGWIWYPALACAVILLALLSWINAKAALMAVALAVLTYTCIRWIAAALTEVAHERIRHGLAILIAFPPVVAFLAGHINGSGILEGTKSRIVSVEYGDAQRIPTGHGRAHYLGQLGEFNFFFVYPEKQVVRLPVDSVRKMTSSKVELCEFFCSLGPEGEVIDRRFWRGED